MKRRVRNKPKKQTKKPHTGITPGMDQFFVGGEWRIAGLMHIKPPRWTGEYEGMAVKALVRRIQNDVKELLARACPNHYAEWAQKFAPAYWRQFPMTYERRLRGVIHESIAESLSPGLMQRIRSPSASERKRARAEYKRLAEQLIREEPKLAAGALAFVARTATQYLEHLFSRRPTLIQEIARTRALWPVNLGARVKIVKGKLVREVTGLTSARDYLLSLELNSEGDFPSTHGVPANSPFRAAAEELYWKMRMLKDDHHAWFSTVTPWAKRLFMLKTPMTESNSLQWWEAAKVYLYERWNKAEGEFEPLIKHLGFPYPIQLSSKVPYPSMIKSRVIDRDLKDAFVGLARPDL
jgi:hypothetical protein